MLSALLAMDIGFKQLYRAVKCRALGPHRYKGNAAEICHQAVEGCWNGSYFLGSAGHYSQFWLRDFGMCVPALIRLGYEKQVQTCLDNALRVYEKHNTITTGIALSQPLQIGYPCPDSLAWLAHAMRAANYTAHKKFIETKAVEYFNTTLDETGLVRKDRKFSALKGGYESQSLLYNNVMTAMLAQDLNALNFLNPFDGIDYKKIIKNAFWNGKAFKNDLITNEVTGDANIFPYFCGIFSDKSMVKSSVQALQNMSLDKPFPLMYRKGPTGYQTNTAWAQIGPIYINVVRYVDRKKADYYISQYTEQIEANHNYLELFTENGKPFAPLVPPYYCDEGMIWASMFLDLIK